MADSADPRMAELLRRVLGVSAALADRARQQLLAAVLTAPAERRLARAREVLEAYRPTFARTLSEATLAGMLAGMRGVVDRLPATPRPSPGALPPSTPPLGRPAGRDTEALLEVARRLPAALRSDFVASLLPADAAAVQAGLASQPPAPPALAIPAGEGEGPRLPLIEEAVADLAGRELLTRPEYDALSADARSRAFTVAGVETEQAVERVRDALVRATAEGTGLRDFRRRLEADLEEGSLLGPAHVETVFRTNLQTAYSRGLDSILTHPLVQDLFPYEATEPIRDSRLSPLCEVTSRSGIAGSNVFRSDDPVWLEYKPPRHWNCRCARVPLTLEMASRRGVREAQDWLRTGRPPERPAWVQRPSEPLPAGWTR